MKPADPTPAEHERRDVPTVAIVKFLAWLLAGTVVTYAVIWGLFKYFEARERREDVRPSPLVAASLKRTPPAPRLEVDPSALKAKLRAEEESRLHSYSWVDRPAGAVRIPIERAMDLIAERGVPGGRAMPIPSPTPAVTSGRVP